MAGFFFFFLLHVYYFNEKKKKKRRTFMDRELRDFTFSSVLFFIDCNHLVSIVFCSIKILVNAARSNKLWTIKWKLIWQVQSHRILFLLKWIDFDLSETIIIENKINDIKWMDLAGADLPTMKKTMLSC